VSAGEAPTVTPLGHPKEMTTRQLLQLAASLLEPFAWGGPIAVELRERAERIEVQGQMLEDLSWRVRHGR
jgi:hypothetical protein